ncbi:MAG: hypothetical protein ACM3X0_06785 [Bacteroidota bacterium]
MFPVGAQPAGLAVDEKRKWHNSRVATFRTVAFPAMPSLHEQLRPAMPRLLVMPLLIAAHFRIFLAMRFGGGVGYSQGRIGLEREFRPGDAGWRVVAADSGAT